MAFHARSFSPVLAAAALAAGVPASAATFSFLGFGQGGAINDNATLAWTFAVSGLDGPLTGISLDLGIAHSWVGDLTITLERPDAATFTIMNRPGVPADSLGVDSNLFIGFGTYTFSDSGVDFTALADPLPDEVNIPHGLYRTAGANDVPSLFDPFVAGLPAAAADGTWTLRISDNFDGDIGSLELARLNLTTTVKAVVPEPGSAMLNLLLGSMGIALTMRRRRR